MHSFFLYLMAAFYTFAGIMHFIYPRVYKRIIPPPVPFKPAVNYLSGVTEIILGILLLFPDYRSSAAWGLILLLVLVFPANIYHFTSHRKGKDPARWILAIRLPFQFILLYWAWLYI